MMKSAKAIKPMLSRVNNYARNKSPQQISDFDLVSSVKVGQPSQKWSNNKVKILSPKLRHSRVAEGEQSVAIHCWRHSQEAVERNCEISPRIIHFLLLNVDWSFAIFSSNATLFELRFELWVAYTIANPWLEAFLMPSSILSSIAV